MALLAGVQERLQQRLDPLRAWLFPRRVFLQLDDQAITLIALDGQSLQWSERVPLPAGLCENGEAVRVDALGDLLGDLMVERGFAGAHADAVLPPAASQWRLVQWPEARWPDDRQQTLALHEQDLGLKTALQYLDLHLLDLERQPPTSLLIATASTLLDRWLDVFSLAGVSLDRLEAADLCVCRGVQQLLRHDPSLDQPSCVVLLHLQSDRTALMVLEHGVPVYARRLPAADASGALPRQLQRWLEFWQVLHPGRAGSPLLVLHGSALTDSAEASQLMQGIPCAWRCLDPLALGWWEPPSADPTIAGPSLAALWGLAATGGLP